MTSATYLAFDLGATSGRALLGQLEDGRLSIRELSRFPNRILSLGERLHWDIYGLYQNMLDSLGSLSGQFEGRLESIGIDTWGVDFALLATDGQILGLPRCYRDPHTTGSMDSFLARMPKEEVYRRTGLQFLPFNSLFQLEALRRDASPLLNVAADLLFIPDLIHYLLCGAKKTEFTFASTSQLYNPKLGNWDGRLLSTLGLPMKLMQEIVMPGTTLGLLDERISRGVGLSPVPIVAVATHDTASAVAAAPAEGDDWAYISSGTWSLMGIESPTPIISDEAAAANFTNEGGLGGGFRVLKNITGLWLLEQCRLRWQKKRICSFDELLAEAEAAEAFVSFIDPDDPAFLNPPDMLTAIGEFCRRTDQPVPHSRGAIVRCILESLALKYRFVLEQLRSLSPRPIKGLHVIGGGSQNEMLCSMTADATGLPVYAGPVEATAIGNLLVQAMAAGHISGHAELRECVRRSFPTRHYEARGTEDWERPWRKFKSLNPI